MRYKGVIFDLDGTLLDTLKDLALSVNTVLGKYGYSEHPVDAYRYFVGDGIDFLVQRAFPPEMITEIGHQELVKTVKEEYGRRWADHTVPYPGVQALLDFLESKAVPKAIFSNKPHEFAVLTVETLLPDWEFVEICGIQPGIPRKPDPHGALLIAEKMDLKPAQIIYLGDTGTDMQTATAGGFFAVGALWGFRPAEELTQNGAQILIESPGDLRKLFKN